MGNCQCSFNKTFYDPNAWQIFSSHKNYQLIRSIHDQKTIMQKWKSSELQNHFQYQARKEMKQTCFLRIHYYGKINSNGSSIKQHSYIITDQLNSLSIVKDLTYFQCMLVLKEIIFGIKLLVQKYGQFQINQNMIWIDQYGKPKIWINDNVAKNKSSFPVQVKLNNFQEYTIKRLINMVGKCAIDSERIGCPSTIKTFFKAVQFFEKQMSSGLFPVEQINLKKTNNLNQKSNLKRNKNFFDQYKQTSIALPAKTLKSSVSLPQFKNIPSTNSIQCSVRDPYQVFPQTNTQKTSNHFTQQSLSTKNSQYFSIMERSNHSSQHQILNKNYGFQNRNNFKHKSVYKKVSLSNQQISLYEIENKPHKAFQMKEKSLKISLDPDELLDQLMKSQNIKFQ